MSPRILAMLTTLLLFGGTAAAQDVPEGGMEGDSFDEGVAGDDMGGDEMGGGDAMPEELGEDEAPADDGGKPISAGLLLGYGIGLDGGLNPWGLGFGVGGGYSFDMGLYLGARFVYYLGEDPVNVWELGVEGGYEVDMGKLTIRPGLGLGIASVTVSIPTVFGIGGGSVSSTELYIAPGAALLYDVSDSFFIGLDARLQLILGGGSPKAIIFLANGGMRF